GCSSKKNTTLAESLTSQSSEGINLYKVLPQIFENYYNRPYDVSPIGQFMESLFIKDTIALQNATDGLMTLVNPNNKYDAVAGKNYNRLSTNGRIKLLRSFDAFGSITVDCD